MKRVAKSFLVFIASAFYVWLLFLSATMIAVRFTLTEPTTVKGWLSDSGVYESIVEEISKLALIQQANEDSLVQITSSDIASTAQDAFPSTTLQLEGEVIIDSFYGWFKGDTSGPEFLVDFSQEKAQFAKLLTDKLEAKINELPECQDAGRFSVQAFDPFKADCRPKDVDLTQELVTFEEEIASSKDLLPETLFTGGDLRVNNASGQPDRIGAALPWVPRVYATFLWAPWVIVGLTVISACVMIFFSTKRRKGIRRFAGGLLFTGVVLVVSGLFLRPALQRINRLSIGSLGTQASFTENIVNPLFEQIDHTYSRYSIYFGAGYAVIGLFAYAGILFTRVKNQDSEPAETEHQPPATHITDQVASNLPVQQRELQATPPVQTVDTSLAVDPLQLPDQQQTGISSANQPEHHARPQRQITRRPPMIQG